MFTVLNGINLRPQFRYFEVDASAAQSVSYGLCFQNIVFVDLDPVTIATYKNISGWKGPKGF